MVTSAREINLRPGPVSIGRVTVDVYVYMIDLTELFTRTCSRCDGLTKGFDVIELIVDVQNCLQAYVGVSTDLNVIVIAFRGTQERSIQNWIEDMYWKQLEIAYPGMPDAMVHHGFYSANHNTNIRPGILNAIETTKVYMGTGHSIGGAMALLCGLDLIVNDKAKDVPVMTFGQPHVGNAAFASFYKKLLPNTIRVVNDHDIVPHLPPYFSYFSQKTYHHFPKEVWHYNIGVRVSCTKLERSVMVQEKTHLAAGNSISDHLLYYDVEFGADAITSCKIVMDNEKKLGDKHDRGNLVLLKNPATSFLKLNATSDTTRSSS